MRMKASRNVRFCLVAAFSLIALWSCGSGGSGGSGGRYDIVDQPLQGAIDGNSYTFVSGFAEPTTYNGINYDFGLYNLAPSTANPWDFGAYPGSHLKVMFVLPRSTGTYPLYIDYSSGDNRTATLYNSQDSHNIICDQGSIRIDSIDTGNGIIEGAIAARPSDDGGNWVNGNFSIQIAPE